MFRRLWVQSRHHILDGHFVTYICCKICDDVCLKRPTINDGRGWPIFLKKTLTAARSILATLVVSSSQACPV